MMKTFDSYVAGLFDGEGCISSVMQYISGKYEIYPRVYIQITITNQHLGVLEKVSEVFGGQISFKDRNPNRCYVWRLIGKMPMKIFLERILPYSIIKKEQIDLGLMFIKTIREENLGCKPLSNATHELRLWIHSKLKNAKIVPTNSDIGMQTPEIAGNSLVDNPQPSLFLGEGSETIIGASQEDDGIVRATQQCVESGRNDQTHESGNKTVMVTQ